MPNVDPLSSSLSSMFGTQRASKALGSALQKLSSGLAVNSAADGPAQLVISEMLRGQIGGIAETMRNAQEAYNVSAIAEGGASQVSDLLAQAQELAVRAANTGTNTPEQVAAYQKELDNILTTIDRTAETTRYGGEQLLNGSTPTRTFQLGPNGTAAEQATLQMPDVRTSQLGTAAGGPALSTLLSGGANDLATNPGGALKAIQQAAGEVASQRGAVGAFQNSTLETTSRQMSVALENVTATESAIRDLNFAEGVISQLNASNLLQSSIYGLRNANFTHAQMLRLLG